MCGAATSLGMILIARAVQGAGGGALQPLSQAILLESFPPQKRGLAMAVFALGVVVAPVLGPTLGGWLTDQYSWRWAFYINIPIGVLAIFMLSRFVTDPPYIKDAKPGKIDAIGFGLLGISLACLQIILDKGQEDDWFGAIWLRWMAVIMIATLIGFLFRELKIAAPLVNLKVFLDRNFALGCLLIGVVRRRDLWSGHAAAALLSDAARLHRVGGGHRGEPARHRRDSDHARDRRPHGAAGQPLADRDRLRGLRSDQHLDGAADARYLADIAALAHRDQRLRAPAWSSCRWRPFPWAR